MPHPALSKGEGNGNDWHTLFVRSFIVKIFQVLSFGEDLGEASPIQ